jgi:hypothetical protein
MVGMVLGSKKGKLLDTLCFQLRSASPFLVSSYLFSFSCTNPAFVSSRSPLLTRNKGCPVLPATSSGDSAPSFSEASVAFPVEVGFPSGDTQGMFSALWKFLLAQVPVFAVITFFESFLCLLYGCGRWNDDWFA